MPEYRYAARSISGAPVSGIVVAQDRQEALRKIEQEHKVPISLEEAGGLGSSQSSGTGMAATPIQTQSGAVSKPPEESSSSATASLPHGLLHLFTEQLGHLLSSGVKLDSALGMLHQRLKQPKLSFLSGQLHKALIEGHSLSEAMRRFPRIFSPLYVNMVLAGESSGALPEILRRLVVYLADIKALRDRVQQALIYPALLLVAGTGLVIIFMTVMVPQLTGFFTETGQTLPTPTRMLLSANHLLTHYWWVACLAAAAAWTGVKVFVRSPEGRRSWDGAKWRFPFFSSVIRHRFYAQFARTLGTLVENDVPLLRSLELLQEISGNAWVRLRMVRARAAVVEGAKLSVALGEQNILPKLYTDMMSVGEQTGRFAETMLGIAEIYEHELDKQVKIISALIPPLIMMAIAAVVGFVVFGILSAIFGLTRNLHPGM